MFDQELATGNQQFRPWWEAAYGWPNSITVWAEKIDESAEIKTFWLSGKTQETEPLSLCQEWDSALGGALAIPQSVQDGSILWPTMTSRLHGESYFMVSRVFFRATRSHEALQIGEARVLVPEQSFGDVLEFPLPLGDALQLSWVEAESQVRNWDPSLAGTSTEDLIIRFKPKLWIKADIYRPDEWGETATYIETINSEPALVLPEALL